MRCRALALGVSLTLLPACGDDDGSTDAGTSGITQDTQTSDASSNSATTPGTNPTDDGPTGGGPTGGGSTDDGPTDDGPTDDGPTDDGPGDDSTTGTAIPEECSPEEAELIDLVNEYRAENGLPAIPLSPSLCIVGHTHAEDLALNNPHGSPECNLHSWSDAGPWTPCCYTSDHAQAECMWNKPAELTMYPGTGYENAVGGGGMITPQAALDAWKGSSAHNAVILNEGMWANNPWGAVGAGLYEGYGVLWFGEEADPLAP